MVTVELLLRLADEGRRADFDAALGAEASRIRGMVHGVEMRIAPSLVSCREVARSAVEPSNHRVERRGTHVQCGAASFRDPDGSDVPQSLGPFAPASPDVNRTRNVKCAYRRGVRFDQAIDSVLPTRGRYDASMATIMNSSATATSVVGSKAADRTTYR